MLVLEYSKANVTDLGNGCIRKVLVHSGALMLVEFSFKKNAVGTPHRHPHEQTGYILYGSFEFEIGYKKYLLKKGDSYYVPANELHGVMAIEDSAILDTFTPQRIDFLNQNLV